MGGGGGGQWRGVRTESGRPRFDSRLLRGSVSGPVTPVTQSHRSSYTSDTVTQVQSHQ